MANLRHQCATAGCVQRVGQEGLFCPTCHFRQVDCQRHLIGLLTVECRDLSANDQTQLYDMLNAMVLAGPLFRNGIREHLAKQVGGKGT